MSPTISLESGRMIMGHTEASSRGTSKVGVAEDEPDHGSRSDSRCLRNIVLRRAHAYIQPSRAFIPCVYCSSAIQPSRVPRPNCSPMRRDLRCSHTSCGEMHGVSESGHKQRRQRPGLNTISLPLLFQRPRHEASEWARQIHASALSCVRVPMPCHECTSA